jgi:hypothetical protein
MKRITAIAMVLGLAACGPKEEQGPSEEQVSTVQKAGTAEEPAEMEQTAANAVVDSGSGGASQGSNPTTGFTYAATIALTLDLDSLNGLGQDRFPNATGLLGIAATGVVTGDGQSGTADYSVTSTALSVCVFTNPGNGATATVLPGATATVTQHLAWWWSDSQNWTVTSSGTGAVNAMSVTVQQGTAVVSGSVTRTRNSSWSFSQSGGTYSASGTWSAQTTVTLSTGHVVLFDVQNLSTIYVVVDGVQFGPYTAGELWAIFGVWVV